MTQYQQLLIEIETWLQSTLEILNAELKTETESQIQNNIDQYNELSEELKEKEIKLQELSRICEEFKKYADLQELAFTLVEQLNTVTLGLIEHKSILNEKIDLLHHYLKEMQKSPNISLESTLSSSSMPVEKIAVHADTKKVTQEIIDVEKPVTSATIETQTGTSLTSTPSLEIRDGKHPTDVQIQTQLSTPSTESVPAPTKETITVVKTIKNGEETIQIATKPENQPIIEEPDDDVLVQADYRKEQEVPGNQTSQVSILHAIQNQPFETVFVEPDETTTEIIVDADGTKRIIVKKLQRKVVRQQQTLQQQQLTTTKTLTEDDIPVSQSFSQITLQGQQSSTTLARGDGRKEVLTTQSYGGKIVAGAPGSEVTIHDFESDPETNYTVVEPPDVEVHGIKLREGDVTLVDHQHATLAPVDSDIHTSSSSVRAVVQQVTRRVIRKTRRIIRRIVIVDGKEQVSEEVVEEPEEIEFTEEGIPRVSINVTRTEDGKVVQDQTFGETVPLPTESEEVSTTRIVTSAVIDAEKPVEKEAAEIQRYVVEQSLAQPEKAPALVTDTVEIISEPNIEITPANVSHEFIQQEKGFAHSFDSSNVEIVPSADNVNELKATKKVPEDELLKETETNVAVDVTEVFVNEQQPTKEKIPFASFNTPISIDEVDSQLQLEVKAETASELRKPEINTKQITREFIENEQTFRPITPETEKSKEGEKESTPIEEKPICSQDKSKKKRKLKGKKQLVCTPRIQSPAIPPEDEEILDSGKDDQSLETQEQDEEIEIVAFVPTSTENVETDVKLEVIERTTSPKQIVEEFLSTKITSSEVIETKEKPEFAEESKPKKVETVQDQISQEEFQMRPDAFAQETQTSITSDTSRSISEKVDNKVKTTVPQDEVLSKQLTEKIISQKIEKTSPSQETEVKSKAVVQETQTSFSPESISTKMQAVVDNDMFKQVQIAQDTQTSFASEIMEPTIPFEAKLTEKLIAQETQTSISPESATENQSFVKITEVAPILQLPEENIKVTVAESIQKEGSQVIPMSTVEFELSLEEKHPSFEVSPKIEASISHEDQVLKDVNAILPSLSERKVETLVKTVALTPITSKTEIEHTEASSNDVDRGGRKSKKKKKHKESKIPNKQEEKSEEVDITQDVQNATPEKTTSEIVKELVTHVTEDAIFQTPETSLAESTDIIFSESQVSEETPKPTLEFFDPATQSEESESTDKEEGYEADKATVDEAIPAESDKKKRRKKKRKQKMKHEESEETYVPQTTTDTSTAGESIKFSEEEGVESVFEPVKKSKKNKKSKKLHDTDVEKEILQERKHVQEADVAEICSVQESYKSMSTPSEPDTVKIVEEKVITPEIELSKDITSKIVTTVPVIAAVITQEAPVQTSPDTSEMIKEFIMREAAETGQASVQTSPEVPKQVIETAMQTTKEEVVIQQELRPDLIESSAQCEIEVNENITQTSTPEQHHVTTLESSVQTITPEKAKVTEEFVQTMTPEHIEIPTSETITQTIGVQSHEECIQTISPSEPWQKIETAEISIQAKQFDISQPMEQFVQTSPVPSAPPLDQLVQTSPIQDLQTSSIETAEIVTQTQPVVIHEIGEITPSPSTSEEYEIFVQTAVTVPGRETVQFTNNENDIPISVTSEENLQVAPMIESVDSANDFENIDVQVMVTDKHTATVNLLDAERSHDQDTRRNTRKRKYDEGKHQPHTEKEDLFVRRSRTPSPTKSLTEESEISVQTIPEHHVITEKEIVITQKITEDPLQPPHIEDVSSTLIESATEQQIPLPQIDPVQVNQTAQTLEATQELIPKQTSESVLLQVTEDLITEGLKEPTTEEPSTTINISITLPSESPPTISETSERSMPLQEPSESESKSPTSLTSELIIDTSEKIMNPSKAISVSKKSNKTGKSVAIEEVLSPTEIADSLVTLGTDAPLSPPDYSRVSYTWDKQPQTKITETQSLLKSERAVEAIPVQDIGIKWNQAQAIERVKNLQNASRTTHLSDVLYLATLNEIITEESIEERNFNVQQNINALREAVVKKDVVEIQHTVITTVQTITTWLETIEYRIYLARQQTADGPSRERVQELTNLKSEISNIENNVAELQSALSGANDVYNEDDRNRMESYIVSLQKQVKVIEEVTEENEQLAVADLTRWEEFVTGVDELNKNIGGIKKQLNELTESDASPQTKYNELERLENANRANMVKAVNLIATAKGLMRDFPGREIPQEIYSNQEFTKQIEYNIEIERERVLQLLSLADEYEQTLKEFSQIIDIADALVESSILVRSLEHLEEEMQNHRKFFVNLSHCRAILESLEQNLDSETRALHSELHQNLYERARVSLDKATGRFQQMSLAASRWTVLEQGMKEEQRWLQVAQQRVPDLSSVTSADYDQYINLYQSLSLDIAHHHAKLSHLNGIAQKLQELVICSELEETYIESLEIIKKLQEDVQTNLKRLIAFRDMWGSYNLLSDKLEIWLKDAEDELSKIESSKESEVPLPGQMRQFWVSSKRSSTYLITYYLCRIISGIKGTI